MVAISFVAAAGLYGIFAFFVSWLHLGISPATIWSIAFSDAGFSSLFAKYMVFSLVLLVAGILIMLLKMILIERKYGLDSSYRMPPMHYIGGVLLYPFQGLLGIFGARQFDTGEHRILYWAQVIGQFVSSIVLIGFIFFGLMSLRE